MISLPTLGVAEDILHLFNPRAAKESVRHFRSGLLFSGSGLKKGQKWSGFVGNLKQTAKAPWDLGFKGTLFTALPIAALMASQARPGHVASTFAGASLSTGLAAVPGALLGGSIGA